MPSRKRRPVAWVATVVAVALVGSGVWWFGLRGRASAEEPTTRTQTVTASTTTLEKTVTGSGTIAPTVQEDVSFAVSGTVQTVAVAAGDTVTAGQTLATVDTLQLNASLLSAKATLVKAQASLADLEDEDDGTSVADAQIAAAAAQVEVAQAAYDAAEAAMADATLVAPVAGLVTSVDLEVGQAVTGSGSTASGSGSTGMSAGGATGGTTTSTAQFVIVGTDAWQVQIDVDDADLAKIAVGDQAELTLDGATDTVFGTVSEIGLLSTTSSGVAAYPVTVQVTGSPEGVHDGVSADVAIVYERRTDVLTVPSAAVRTVDGQSVVYQSDAEGGQVSVPVTVGETSGTLTEITDGLSAGDEVLVTIVTQTGGSDRGQEGESGSGFPEGFPTDLPDGFPTDFPSDFQGGFPGGGQRGGSNG